MLQACFGIDPDEGLVTVTSWLAERRSWIQPKSPSGQLRMLGNYEK